MYQALCVSHCYVPIPMLLVEALLVHDEESREYEHLKLGSCALLLISFMAGRTLSLPS